MEMHRISGSKKVSKTLIVEEALKMAFTDFDLKKDSGKFYSNLVRNKEIIVLWLSERPEMLLLKGFDFFN